MLRLRMTFLLLAFHSFALAEVPSNAMQNQIEHVVVLMLENRSFDNLLAWLYSDDAPQHFIPSGADPHYLGLSEATLPLYTNILKNSSGQIVFSSPPIKGIPSVAGTPYLNSPSYNPEETFPNVTEQIFGNPPAQQAVMTGFLQNYALLWDESNWLQDKKLLLSCLETYTPKELPVMNALAKHYAVSDEWFSSVPTQTNPNRAFAACGTSQGQVVNGPLGKSLFTADTIWNRLTDLTPDSTWMIFWQTDMLPGFYSGPLTGPNSFENMKEIPNLGAHYLKIDSFHELARKGQLPQFSFIEPQLTTSANLLEEMKRRRMIVPEGMLLGLEGNDMHPPGDVRTAENLLMNIYTSLIANPDTWNKTLLIVTFDEHGGIFDHIPPPAAIPPDQDNQDGFNFDRYGVRVPAIFISPLIEKNTVVRSSISGIPFDHTSLIATILQWFKVEASLWNMGNRAAAAPTFDTVVTRSQPRLDPVLSPAKTVRTKNSLGDVVQMTDRFYLKDKNGNYLVKDSSITPTPKNNEKLFLTFAHVGPSSEKVALKFSGGSQSLTHGSFAVICAEDPLLNNANFLQTYSAENLCIYDDNEHAPNQWWTIKSVDYPYVGQEIHYGDRIYLENHIYLNVVQYVSGRLAKRNGFLSDILETRVITDADANSLYWTIEKAD